MSKKKKIMLIRCTKHFVKRVCERFGIEVSRLEELLRNSNYGFYDEKRSTLYVPTLSGIVPLECEEGTFIAVTYFKNISKGSNLKAHYLEWVLKDWRKVS